MAYPPELLVDRSYTATARRHGRMGRYSFAAAIVVYFSSIQQHVPLLAPLLGLIWVYSVYRMFRCVWPAEKTKIMSEWGDEIAIIPHHESMVERRKNFEDALREAIREARHKHYET